MQKCYLLLRNNQQSGPYTLEEVKQLPLQSKDLIWIIGQSAGWRYPEEIDALQYVPAESKDTTIEMQQDTQGPVTAHASAKTNSTATPQHIYISMPLAASGNAVTTVAPSNKELESLSFDERVEKMQQRIALVNSPKKEEATIEVKYNRSLEDIKTEYAEWLQTQKRKPKRSIKVKPIAITAFLIALIAGSYWLAIQLHTPASSPLLVQNSREERNNDPQQTESVTKISRLPGAEQYQPSNTNNSVVTEKTGGFHKPVLKNEMNKPGQEPVQTTQPLFSDRNAEKQTTANTVLAEVPAAEEKTPDGNIARQIHVTADYIPVQKQKGVGGLAVTVKNNSTHLLKVIAVDVIYFTDAMKEIDRKTLYFSDILPGAVTTLNAPAHKKAEGAFAQLGLISSESGSLFFASNR